MFTKSFRAIVCLFLFSVPLAAFATNGMYLIGFGAKSRGMGGASLAMSEDSLIAATNPAGVAFAGNRLDVGLMLFNPQRRAACCNAPNGEVSGQTLFAIPNMGASLKLTNRLSAGFAFVGAGGGGTRYGFNFFGGDGTLGVTLFQAIMSPTVAYKVTNNVSVGFSPLFAVQQFRASGLQPFIQFSSDKAHVTNQGNDWAYGYGGRVGIQARFLHDRVALGAAYQTELRMSKFDKYRGLFADHGQFNGPANFGIGLAFKPIDRLTVALDWQRVFYKRVHAIGNRSLPIAATPPPSSRNLGLETGPGFGWQDMSIYKLGIQYRWSPKLTLRAGFNFNSNPIRNEPGSGELEFNVLAPAVVQRHYTAGFTYAMSRHSQFSFAGMIAARNRMSVFIASNTGLPFANRVEVEMRQYSLEMSYEYKF